MLVIQGNLLVTTTRVSTVMLVDKAWLLRIKERGKELKVPYYASAAAVCDGNLPYIMAICLYSQQ